MAVLQCQQQNNILFLIVHYYSPGGSGSTTFGRGMQSTKFSTSDQFFRSVSETSLRVLRCAS